MLRKAASPEVVDAIARHYRSDGIDDGAAAHLAAETVAHPEQARTSISELKSRQQELEEQGYSDDVAPHLALEEMEMESDGDFRPGMASMRMPPMGWLNRGVLVE